MKEFEDSNQQNAIIGGLIISAACCLNYCVVGRITGMSGFISGLFSSELNSHYKISCILSLFISSSLAFITDGRKYFPSQSEQQENLSTFGFVLGGLLVGAGSKLANGCTSGHGICGTARLQKRSFVAVILFIIGGVIMQALKQNISGLENSSSISSVNEQSGAQIVLGISVIAFVINLFLQHKNYGGDILETIFSSACVALFAFGLIVSGAIHRNVIYGFLDIFNNFNPQLLYILGSAILPTMIIFYFIERKGQPFWKSSFDVSAKSEIDAKLIIGALLFGLGWGLAGLCPGTSFVLFPNLTSEVAFIFLPCIIIAHYVIKLIENNN